MTAETGRHSEPIEITLEMIEAGLAAYRAFDPEEDEPAALVFAILWRAISIIPGFYLLYEWRPRDFSHLASSRGKLPSNRDAAR